MRQSITANLRSRQVTLLVLFIVILLSFVAIFSLTGVRRAQAAACTPPATDYGTVTMSVNIPATANYRIWSNILAPDNANNSYLLEVDGNSCYVVGDNSITPDVWKWVDYQNGTASSKITINLSAGTHTFKAIGREDKVQIDKLIFTSDTSCVPTGNGSNCTTTTPPPPPPPPPPAQPVTDQLFHKYNRNIDSADFTIYSNSGSNRIESHIWNPGMQSWQKHIASNQSSVTNPDLQVLYGDLDGSGYDYPVLFGLKNTATGKIEGHVWNHEMTGYLAHTASNQAVINTTDCKILLTDLEGIGKDNSYLVCMRNTASGKVEIHKWAPGLQSWSWHVITNLPSVDPTKNTVLAADIDGNKQDELILVSYAQTGSGKVEFHIWNPGFNSWRSHIASNMSAIDPTTAKVEFADIDGNGVDEPVLVGFKTTGSGKVEFHIWNPGFTSWRDNIASNLGTL